MARVITDALAGTYISTTSYSLDGTVRGQNGLAIGGLPGETLLYEYDTWLRPTRLSSQQAAYVNDTTYTPTGKKQLVELGSTQGKRAWQTFGYEHGTQRLTTARTLREGITGADRDATYRYDDAGNVTAVSDASRDGTDTQCFNYDGLRRLTQAWTQSTTTCAETPQSSVISGPAPYWHTFGYDTAGNRKTETRHGIAGQPDTDRTYTYATPGNGNRLQQVTKTGNEGASTDTYSYDATGNTTERTVDGITQTLDWGPSGELTKVADGDNTTTYIYGPDGERLLRKDPSGATLHLPSTELRLNNGSTTPTGTRYYAHAGQTVAMRTPTGVTYLAGDHQGTAQAAVNATDQTITTRRYTAFGTVRGLDEDATWPNDKGFVGGTSDPTGLTHLGAREYDPDTGRFISVDPLLDQADPQQMNGYTYANNSPVTNSDPDGLMPAGIDGRDMDSWAKTNGKAKSVPCYKRPGGCGIAREWGEESRIWSPPKQTGPSFRDILIAMARHDAQRQGAADAQKAASLAMGGFQQKNTFSGNPLEPEKDPIEDFLKAIGVGYAYDCAPGFGFNGGNCWIAASVVLPVPKVALLNRALKVAKKCSSFVPGTAVLMANGSYKLLEDVVIGDQVIATNTETGQSGPKTVLDTITSKGTKDLVQITINETYQPYWTTSNEQENRPAFTTVSSKHAATGVVIATDEHPFWVAGDLKQWVKATDLKSGMWLRTSAGTYVQVTSAKHWTKPSQRVHNLTIAEHHTFYVLAGDTPVLVHNSGPCPTARFITDANGVTIDLKPLGRGSTGRTAPNSLNEQLAMETVMANPTAGRVIPLKKGMTDPRWMGSDGWVKMTRRVNMGAQGDAEIHYVMNTITGHVDDYKFK